MDQPVTNDPDRILLDQFVRTRDAMAFDQIARRYRPMVFSTARRVTQSHHDAEDVAQGCFLELAKKASSIRISIPAFLHQTATRRSIDLLRDRGRRKKYERTAAAERVEPDADSDPAERSWDEISPEVDHAIDRLPEELKTIVLLYFLRGLSIADIGAETGLRRGMIERRLQLGIRRLRADLSKGSRSVPIGVIAAGLKAGASAAVPASLTAATGRLALATSLATLARGPLPGPIRWWIRLPRWAVAAVLAAVIAIPVIWHQLRGSARPAADQTSASPYDRLASLYGTGLTPGETSGFQTHVAAIRADAFSFWRGSQPLFFQWTKSNCPDWFSQTNPRVLCHCSPNLEDAQRLSLDANSDNTARLPIQVELLQGMVIARLSTDRNFDNDSEAEKAKIAAVLCESYRTSLTGDRPGDNSRSPADPNEPRAATDINFFDTDGKFKPVILGRLDKVAEFLRPSPIGTDQVERMLAAAVAANPDLAGVFGTATPKVRQVRSSVRHDAVVAQGQLVLLAQLEGSGVLVEIKQRTHSSAELAGAASVDSRTPGRRAAEDARELSADGHAPIGWCDWNGQSFTIAPLDVRSRVYELRKDRWVDPVQAATQWAVPTAATHRLNPHRTELAAAITPELEHLLVVRSDAYLAAMQADLRAFTADPRFARDRNAEDALMTRWLEEQSGPVNPAARASLAE